MEKMYTEDKEEIEIDLRELLFELKKRLWLILVALFLEGDNFDFSGRSSNRQSAYTGLQGFGQQPAGYGGCH